MLNKRQFNKSKKTTIKTRQPVKRNEILPSTKNSSEDDNYDEYLAMKAELQAEYDDFDKDELTFNNEEHPEPPIVDPIPEDVPAYDIVEVTGSVEQFDESYLEEKDEDDWISSEYFFD